MFFNLREGVVQAQGIASQLRIGWDQKESWVSGSPVRYGKGISRSQAKRKNRRLRKSCFSGSSDEDEGIKHGGGAGRRAREVTWGQLMSCDLGGILM